MQRINDCGEPRSDWCINKTNLKGHKAKHKKWKCIKSQKTRISSRYDRDALPMKLQQESYSVIVQVDMSSWIREIFTNLNP